MAGDDKASKIISRLEVNYEQAIKGVRELKEEYEELNKLLGTAERQVKASASNIGQAISGGVGSGIEKMAAGAKKSIRDVSVLLPKLEAQLSQMQARLVRAGLDDSAYSGKTASLREQVSILQDQLSIEGELGKEETKHAAQLSKQVRILREQINTTISDAAPSQLRFDQQAKRIAAERKMYEAIAKEESQSQLRAEADAKRLETVKNMLPNLQAQVAAVQSRIRLEKIGDETLQSTAAHYRRRVEEIMKAATAQKTLTAEQAQEVELLQTQIRQLSAQARTLVADKRSNAGESASAKLQMQAAAAEERRLAAANAVLPKLQAEVAAVQSRLKLEKIGDLTLRASAASYRKRVEDIQKAAAAQKTLTAEQVKEVELLKTQIHQLTAQTRTVAADQRSRTGGTLASMMSRRAEWFLAGGAFYGAQQATSALLTDIGDIEQRMISLGRVMEDPLFNIKEMRTELFQLGEDYGQSFQTVQDVALRWAQAGYTMKESLDLTRASLLAVNTAELDAENATQSLIGIMAQWGLQSDQLIGVIDKINKVADDYATTSQDLVDGLLRSSGAARNANMTLEQTIAMLTAMREASGRTGKEVGNALNSIISYTQRDVFLKAMEKAGIPAFSDAANQELRPTFDIISDLAKNWDGLQDDVQRSFIEQADNAGLFSEEMAEASGTLSEWTDLQKRDLLQAGAGIYRRNYLLALLKNFSQVYDVLQTQEQAIGYSQRENERTMEGYARKVQSLQTAFQELGYALAEEGGLLDILKSGVTTIKDLVEGFNDLPSSTKKVIIALGEIAAAVSVLSSSLKLLTGVGLAATAKKLGGLFTTATRSAGGLAATLAGMGKQVVRFAPWIAALGAVTYGIVKMNQSAYELQDNFDKTREKTDNLIRSSEAEAETHSQNAVLIGRLADQYRVLAKTREEARKRGEEETDIAIQQDQISEQVRQALGDEVAARLEAAAYSESATADVVQAERDKANEIAKSVQEQIAAYQDNLREQMATTLESINVIEKHQEGWLSYLGVWDKVKYYWADMIKQLRFGWAEFMKWISLQLAKFGNLMADAVARYPDFLPGSGAAQKLEEQYRRYAHGYERNAMEYDLSKISIQRDYDLAVEAITDNRVNQQRELLANIRQELQDSAAGAGANGGGGGGGSDGEYGTGDDTDATKEAAKTVADVARDLADAYTAQTEALQNLGDAYQRQESLLKNRIDYYTREGATFADLTKADKDRASLLDQLSKRQTNLHDTAEAARQAMADLAAQQAKVDKSTEDGQKAYEEFGNAILEQQRIAEDASAEWWSIEKEKAELQNENNAISRFTIDTLEELQDQYDKGTISLEEYIRQMAILRRMTGLSTEALEKLSDAQAKAQQEQWSRQIQDALEARTKEIDGQIDLLDKVTDDFNREQSQYDRSTARSNLFAALAKLAGTDTFAGGVGESDITKLAEGALSQFADLDLGDLTPEAFADAMRQNLSTLRDTSRTAQSYLDRVSEDHSRQIDRIQRKIDRIDERLQDRLAKLQAELDALDEEETQDQRQDVTDDYQARRKSLEDQLAWYLQNEEKYAFEIAALRKQMAEADKEYADQEEQWRRDDRRKAIQDEMDQAQEEADARKKALESQREELEQQQETIKSVLESLIAYIQTEIESRQELLDDEKEQLNQTKDELNDSLDEVTDKVLSTLATMSEQSDEFYGTSSGLIQRLIDGISDEKGKLEDAVRDIKDLISSIPKSVSVGVSYRRSSGGSSNSSGSGSSSWLGPIYTAAEGAYVKGGLGGVLSLIGEKSHDEAVLPVNKLQPMINEAVARASVGSAGLSQAVTTAVRAAVQEVAGLFPSKLEAKFVLPDGTIEKQVVSIFSPLRQAVRMR